jgi:zinc transport system substrate-binding protein
MKKIQFTFGFFIQSWLFLLCLFACLQTANANNNDKKNIVVTIKPLEGLLRAIAKDTINIQRLLPDYASPHHYHFRPSDISKVKAAHLIFRIDEDMERFVVPLFQLLDHRRVISLADLPHIQLLKINNDEDEGRESEEEHSRRSHEKHNEQQEHHHHGDYDLHLWMSPQNGMVMAEKITHELVQLNPQHRPFYQKNLVNLRQNIQQFMDKFQVEAQPLQGKPYLVFHDSWHYFAHTFHLQKLATINLHADIQLGVKTILQTRKRIKQFNAHCLFSEPLFRPKTIAILTEGFTIKTVELDTLGSHLNSSDNLYLDLLRYTAQQIKHCLSS